jgi:DNA-binding transcriptional regulator YiaG
MKNKELIEVDVHIPSADGKSVERIEKAQVWAEYSEDYQDYILDGEALAEIERVKARHMGLLSPEQIGALRNRLGVTQKQIADLLQIGAKSWTRWETGRDRPSRSINILIRALDDGQIDLNYLRSLRDGNQVSPSLIDFLKRRESMNNRSLSMRVDENSFCRNADNSFDYNLERTG